MLTTTNRPFTCAVCGETTEFPIVTSTEKHGGLTFALCPPQELRATLPTSVQVCPHCGYASKAINRPTKVTRQWLSSSDYASLADVTGSDSEAPLPASARNTYMSAKCYLFDGDKIGTINSLLSAAWICDDEGEATAGYAKRFRLLAIDLTDAMLKEMMTKGQMVLKGGQPLAIHTLIRHLDAMRRVGRFARADELCSALRKGLLAGRTDRLLLAVLDYEHSLIEAGDTDSHELQEAIESEMSMDEYLLYETSHNMKLKMDQLVADGGDDADAQGEGDDKE